MKKILSTLFALTAALSAVPAQTASAANSAIEVGTVSASAGEEVSVPITVTENAGIIAMGLLIRYDASKLTLLSVEDTHLFSGAEYSGSGKTDTVPYHLTWVDALTRSDYTNTGDIAILHFKVSDSAADGLYEIGLEIEKENTFNMDMTDIPFTGKSGGVKIGTGDVPVVTAPAGNQDAPSYADPEQAAKTAAAGGQTSPADSTAAVSGTASGSTAQSAQSAQNGTSAGTAAASAQASGTASAAATQPAPDTNSDSGTNLLWLLIPTGLLAVGASVFFFRRTKQAKTDGEPPQAG